MDIELSGFYKITFVLVTIFTLGIGGIAMWFQLRKWPKHIDTEGIILRNGKHVSWGEFTEDKNIAVVNQMGHSMGGRKELLFGDTIVQIVAPSLKNGQQVLQFVDGILFEREIQDVTHTV